MNDTHNDTYVENETYIEYFSKPLGLYLQEANLLTEAQIRVALWDQKSTGLLFGDVLLVRGWVDEATLKYYLEQQHSV